VWTLLLLLAGSHWLYAQSVEPAVYDVLEPVAPVAIGDFIGQKLNASYQNRILAQDVDRLVEPFRHREESWCWQSEFWGKWFTSAVLAYRYQPDPDLKAKLDTAVDGLLSTQSPDGYIGNYAPDKHLAAWDIWGRKYCMLGLLAYYDLVGDPRVLEAAVKLADHLIGELNERNALIVKQGNHRGMAASSVLEPVCLLYVRTGEPRFLDFAEEIVRQWETPEGPRLLSKSHVDVGRRFPRPTSSWYGWEQGQKAYEMMSCYEGLLELYRITGEEDYRAAVEATWRNILQTEINIAGSGAAMEAWFGGKEIQALPIYHYQETCVTVTWIKLNQQLLRLTGKTCYADAIEQAYYNALLGSMKPDGSDWAKYTPLSGQRLEGSEQCGMGLNCCVASGPRALFTLPQTTIMRTPDGVQINFFTEGTWKTQSPTGNEIGIVQSTDYPAEPELRISVNPSRSEEMAVLVRIPGWSQETILKVNGVEQPGAQAGECARIQRKWAPGDTISLTLDMRGRVHRLGVLPEHIAITRGPIVLAREERLGAPDIGAILQPVESAPGFIDLKPVDPPADDLWMSFAGTFLPESYKETGPQPIEVILCDYATAGNTLDSYPFFKVWLPQLINPRTVPQP
jgi:DUF1680 family protein